MASADDLISIPALRDHLGVVGDADDAMLTLHRDAGIKMLERFTGRNILDRSHVTLPKDFFFDSEKETISFRVADLRPAGRVDWLYAEGDAPSGAPAPIQRTITRLDADTQISFDSTGLTAWASRQVPRLGSWRERMRLFDPVPSLIADVGLAAGDIPDEFRSAVVLIVRGLVDGHPVDLSKGSLKSLLLHFTPALGTQPSV